MFNKDGAKRKLLTVENQVYLCKKLLMKHLLKLFLFGLIVSVISCTSTQKIITPETFFRWWGGLVSTMSDYSRFCMMLRNYGDLDGKGILKTETVKMIMSDQLPKSAKYKVGYGYGLAGEVKFENSEYSWSGAASTTFSIVPKNDLIIITYTS